MTQTHHVERMTNRTQPAGMTADGKHPGGTNMTRHLLELSGLVPRCATEPDFDARCHTQSVLHPCRILDMGSGDGISVEYLQNLGFDALGIDLADSPVSGCIRGDFLKCPFEPQSFNAILSECAFFISGDPFAALKEAARLLKKGGLLLLADVHFSGKEQHLLSLSDAGFSILHLEDITPVWKEYYLSCIWNDTVEELCPCIPRGKCSYYLTICERM